MRVVLIFILFVGFSLQGRSEQLPSKKTTGSNSPKTSYGSLSDKDAYNKAGCPPSEGKLLMDYNDVKALVEVGGSMWQNRQTGTASYEVPVGSGNSVLYSGAIWMGGLDVNNQLKLAAVKFRQGNDFWPGPLSVNVGSGDFDPSQPVGDDATRDFGAATIDPDVCIQYDKFFTVKKSDVINFTLAYQCSQDPNCTENFPLSNSAIQGIYNWPAHGDVSRGQDYYLAPFYDNNKDGVYNPDDGDTPWYDDILNRDDVKCGFDRRVTLFGDITHWWVFNDKGNIHTETGADPIGMEIRAQAFSFATNDEVNQMTFYNYQMINRSTQTLYQTYFSQYADPDVGFANDDYVGCDVSRGLGYAFNGVQHDPGQSGAPGYGDNPPAIGIDFFQGPYQDADGIDNPGPRMGSDGTEYVPTVQDALDSNGIVYSGIGVGYGDDIIDNERFGMRSFNYYDRKDAAVNPGATDDPVNPGDFYNYMTGHWKDNSPYYYGGKGYSGTAGATSTETNYCYPGDSDPLHWATQGQDMGWDWSESDRDGNGNANSAGDRRFLETAGPFTLTPGAINNLTVGVVYGRAFSGDPYQSVLVMRKNDTKAQALFDNCFQILNPPEAPRLQIVELENKLVLMIDNPFGNNVNESYAEEDNINIVDPVGGPPYDHYYRFEGYQIYQMVDEEAKVSAITNGNIEKARLVAQCDLKNDVPTKIINYTYNDNLGYTVASVKVANAENKGIQHSFEITQDAFTNAPLINHKTYYYIAIAYAYNNYKTYDPMSADGLDGQKMPYISSRLSYDGQAIKAVAGIPHTPQPRFAGTKVQLGYGASPEITTLDGKGNGGNIVDLTKESEDYILAHGSIDKPTYQVGRGPIDVKVVNPLNVKGGYYVLSLTNPEVSSNPLKTIDSAGWVIKRYDHKNGTLLETVSSDRSITSKNEQLIPKWGISVNLYQNPYNCIVPDSSCTYKGLLADPLEATITFADSSKRWLTGVSNTSDFSPQNWIMTGDFKPDPNLCSNSLGYQNPCCYKTFTIDAMYADQNGVYANLLNGTVTLGMLARRNDCGYTPIGADPGVFGAIQKLAMSSIYQSSVDIVITSDKSKWTRCPVIELGSDPNLTVGGAISGLLRKSPSVDKQGLHAGQPGYVASEANPNGNTPYGMGWFPGYAIDVETGRRLNMAFGENSFLAGQNGADMVWNPTSNMYSPNGLAVMGGQQPIYVFGRSAKSSISFLGDVPNYDKGVWLYDLLKSGTSVDQQIAYGGLSWVYNPLTIQGRRVLATDVRIRLRIKQEYSVYNKTGDYNGMPTYSWNMSKFETVKENKKQLAEALKIINVVPNPYYAFSKYERDRLDTRVKIVNLPEVCKVRIYNTSGKLVRAFDKNSPTSYIDWDLKNEEKIPVAGGVYLIHVHVPNVGDRVVKFFGGMRQPDLENL